MKWKRLVSWLICTAMLLSLLPAGVLSLSAEEVAVDVTKLTCYGRTYEKDGALYLYWANSGFSFRFNGTGATATLTADNQTQIYWGYLNVYVDGEFVPSKTVCLDKATQTVTLAEGLPAGEHTIEVRKRNEAAYGGSSTIGVQTLTVTDGEFLDPPAAHERQIEVIGDSITSGFGNLDIGGKSDKFTTEWQDSTMTYAVLAAKQLGANASIVSRSGIGFCQGSETMDSIYTYYDKTASLPGKTGDEAAYDFAANPSDVVVINLGTNDNGAKIGGASITDAKMTEEAVALLTLVREKNPNAVIIWTYGLMGNSRRAALEAAVNTFAESNNDDKVFYLPLDNYVTATEGVGTHGHPAMQAHINRSAVLANFIAEKTGWTRDAKAMLQAQLQFSSPFNTAENLAAYTPLSAKGFTDALTAGEALVDNANATSDDFAAAANAIWQAYTGLVSTADMAEEYVVIDSCDATNTHVEFGAGTGGTDSEDYKEGAACLSVTGSSGLMCINHVRSAYNVELPEDWQDWYLELWLYVSDPTALPGESCLEVAQVQDSIEVAWALSGLGLKAGWNKLQLKMSSSNGKDNIDKMEKITQIRLYMVNVKKELTVKMDQIVLAKGKAAANITAWSAALTEAETLLAASANEALQAAYDAAKTATSQADVDAATARLTAAIEAAKAPAPVANTTITVTKNLDKVTRYGRTYAQRNNVLYFYWTNAGLSFRFNGTGAEAKLYADNLNANYVGYLNVYVDGEFAPSKTICLDKSMGDYVLAEGLTPGEHTIELRKRNEAGGTSNIGIKTLTVLEGDFLEPPAAPTRVIEFVGDSITCGFGNIATDKDEAVGFTSHTEEGTLTYAVLAAKQLGANASVVARSGIHYCHSDKPDGGKVSSFYEHYANTATLPDGVAFNEPWDFEANPSDVVVINLGTNDVGAKRDTATYTAEAIDFLTLVREKNPNAIIIWTYGMMGNSIQPALQAAVETFAKENNDDKVFYLPLESYVSTTEGVALGHPTVQTDINRSIIVAEFIADLTGWEVNALPMLQAQLQNSAPYTDEELLKTYTADSAKAFTDAYAAGEALVEKADATNDELVAAATAVWKAQWALLPLSEITDEYIVVKSMDSKSGWSVGGSPNGVDTTDYKEGTGCVYTTYSSGSMVNINSSVGLKVDMPEDWQNWYLECWLYVDHPENIPSGSCIEISQTVDNIEVQWGLDSLNLQPGWNKVQLRMGGGSISNGDSFNTLQNIRIFVVNMTGGPLTLKVDNIVLAKGKVAANTTAWETALAEAQALLAAGENAELKAAYDLATTAVTQADVDAFTVRLTAAIETAKAAGPVEPEKKWGDVDGNNKVNTTDARLTLQFAAGRIDETKLDASVADVDGNDKVNTTDARLILQKAAGRIDKFPVEETAE